MFLDRFTTKYTRLGTMQCISLYPTIAFVVFKNGNHKPNTIVQYAMKCSELSIKDFHCVFVCAHINEFNCFFGSKQLRNYAIHSLIWGYGYQGFFYPIPNGI